MDFIDDSSLTSGETEQDRREALADKGFTGTLRGFLDWIAELLMYGGLVESEPQEHPVFRGREVVEIAMITGGFSTDEHLLSRVFRDSVLLRSWWESTHAGGRYVYLIPTSSLASDEEREWLKPDNGVFESSPAPGACRSSPPTAQSPSCRSSTRADSSWSTARAATGSAPRARKVPWWSDPGAITPTSPRPRAQPSSPEPPSRQQAAVDRSSGRPLPLLEQRDPSCRR